MKTLILSVLCAAGLTATAGAQIFRPQIANDVLIGGVAGAIIGNNNHHRTAEGALIGAAAGYLWGVATTPPSQPTYAPPVPIASSYYSAPRYGYVTPAPTIVYSPFVGYRHYYARRGYYGAPAAAYWGRHYNYSSYRGYSYNRHNHRR
jgi:hypothetical protein